jgi:hypothetical protein
MDIRKYFVVNGNSQENENSNSNSNSKSVDKSSDKLLDKSNKNEIEIEKKTKYNIFEAFADGSS